MSRLVATRRSPAQALVEFAFTLPMFLVMLLAMVDFGLGVYTYNSVSYAAQEGMRRGIVLGKDCGAYAQNGNMQNIATGTTADYYTSSANGVAANSSSQQTFTTSATSNPNCNANSTTRMTIVGAVNNALGILDRSNARVVIEQAPGGTSGVNLPATSEDVKVRVLYRYRPIWGFVMEGFEKMSKLSIDLIMNTSSVGQIQ